MERSELILEFIDGTLDGSAEQRLFDELARHPEFRSEMRQFIAIGEAVRADREAYMPPYEVEQALMTGLGLAPLAGGLAGGASAGAAGAAVVAAPAGSFLGGLLTKLGLMKGLLPFFATFMLGGIVVGGGVYFGMKDSDPSMAATVVGTTSDRASGSGNVPATPAPVAAAPALAEPTGSAASTSNVASVAQPASPSFPSAARRNGSFNGRAPRYQAPRASSIDSRETTPALTSENRSREIAVSTPDTTAPATSTTPTSAVSNTTLREVASPVVDSSLLQNSRSPAAMRPIDIPAGDDQSTPERFIVEGRYSGTLLRNKNEAALRRSKPEDVFAFGLYYRADESYRFGVEAGQERYWETFFDKRRDGDNNEVVVRTDQAPLLYWFGFTGRYMATELLEVDGMTPFAQLTVGAANHGPLARARLGAEFDLASRFSISAAAEGSTLLYFYNTQSMASTNAGLTVGLQYKFR